MSILRYYERKFQNQGWVWTINERWVDRTIEEVKFLAGFFSKGDRILDVGCGTGRHIVELVKRGYQTIGVDISKEMLTIAKSNLRQSEQELIRADAAYLPLADNSFNHAISMYNVFLELSSGNQRLEALKQMERVIKRKGYIIIDLPSIIMDSSWKPSDQTHKPISLKDRDFWELISDEKEEIQDRVFIHYVGRQEIEELIEKARLELIELAERSGRMMAIARKAK